jgi:hypothetical protein
VAEGRVGERLERLVQRPQLVRDAQEPVRVVEPAVENVKLGGDAIETLEHRVELAIVEGLPGLRHTSGF